MLQKFHAEYKLDFDRQMAQYFYAQILRHGVEIYDLKCFDANMPPMDPARYRSLKEIEGHIMN